MLGEELLRHGGDRSPSYFRVGRLLCAHPSGGSSALDRRNIRHCLGTKTARTGPGSVLTVRRVHLLDLVLPRRCGVCDRVGASVCPPCLARLVPCGPPCCERCGAPGPWPVRRCVECSGRRLAFATARAAIVYEHGARALVASWKERGRRDLTGVAAELVVSVLPKPAADVITFVPGDRDRGLSRGHVPAAALASELAAAWSIPAATLLRRRPGVKRQRDLPRNERRGNVARVFTACGASPARVCLVDDVYTTGSTATACATALRRAGARRVDVVCLARALR